MRSPAPGAIGAATRSPPLQIGKRRGRALFGSCRGATLDVIKWRSRRGGNMADFDGVVIGAGHNGLTLAAYLSRAGMRIAVLERNERIGGGSSTEERILPGYKLNLHANFYMGLGLCPLLQDLELHRFGFSYIEPPVQQAAVFRDGTGIVIYKDLDKTYPSLARFSKQDAVPFRPLLHTYCEDMLPLLISLLHNAPMPPQHHFNHLTLPHPT